MDEAAFHTVRPAMTGDACVFERALLARCAGCGCAVVHALAERETIGCASPSGRARCCRYLGALRERAAFTLGRTPAATDLPHALVMRLTCGGLAGLASALDRTACAGDVQGLLAAAEQRFPDFLDLPWAIVTATVAAWRARRRHEAPR